MLWLKGRQVMLTALKKNISERRLIAKGSLVVVGVSGGRDSVALLAALRSLADEGGFALVAAHFNHGIRGAEADADEKFTLDLCRRLGVECRSVRADVPAQAVGDNLEAVARSCRYEWLWGIVREYADRGEYAETLLATAHHLEDQGETVLLHLLRGTGTDGIGGMRFRSGNLIRPLLNIPRAEIEKYIAENNLPYRDDASNFQMDYRRNKIRLELWPELQKYNANINAALGNLAEICGGDADFLDEYTEDVRRRLVRENDYGYSVERREFAALHIAVRRRLVRRLWQLAVTEKPPVTGSVNDNLALTMVQTEDILHLGTSKQISLPKQVYAKVLKDKMYIGKLPAAADAAEFPFEIKKNRKNK